MLLRVSPRRNRGNQVFHVVSLDSKLARHMARRGYLFRGRRVVVWPPGLWVFRGRRQSSSRTKLAFKLLTPRL
jgi:hypothetical protein